MKINGNQIKIGNILEHKGSLWVVTKAQAVKPGKGGAFNQVELKSVMDTTKLNERFVIRMSIGQTHTEMKHIEKAWLLLNRVASETNSYNFKST